MANLTVGGVAYAPITAELYEQLMAEKEINQKSRYLAVEDARVWCEGHLGVSDLDTALGLCTVDQLSRLMGYVYGYYSLSNLVYELLRRLRLRQQRAREERDGAAVTAIMPPEEG